MSKICNTCRLLEDQLAFMRKQNELLTQSLVVTRTPVLATGVLGNSSNINTGDYYGNHHDQIIGHDDLGREVFLQQEQHIASFDKENQ